MARKPALTRRQFTGQTIATGAAAVAAPFFVPQAAFGANDRLNVAAIGAGGKGTVDIAGCARENIVALCDVDQARASQSFNRYPKATRIELTR